jgi:hypothetical protein
MLKIDKLLLLACELRARAREVLALAETMKDPHARQMMREIAARYEELAERLEYESAKWVRMAPVYHGGQSKPSAGNCWHVSYVRTST